MIRCQDEYDAPEDPNFPKPKICAIDGLPEPIPLPRKGISPDASGVKRGAHKYVELASMYLSNPDPKHPSHSEDFKSYVERTTGVSVSHLCGFVSV